MFLFSKRKGIALASFPRSGNTWLRFLIEEATGEKTGSIYTDRIMPRERNGIVIKTHKVDSKNYKRAVLIVRHPFDAIESYFHWKIDIAGKTNIEWNQHVSNEILYWEEHTRHWMNASIPVLLVRYEDIKTNPTYQLNKILNWIDFPCEESKVKSAVKASSLQNLRKKNSKLGDRFFRSGKSGQSLNRFSVKQKETLSSKCRDLLAELEYNVDITET